MLIGIMTDQNPNFVVGLLGALKSGNGFVPLSPDDPVDRISFMVQDCGVELLITEEKHLARAMAVAQNSQHVRHVVCLDATATEQPAAAGFKVHSRDDIERARPLADRPTVDLDDTVYVVYTSGTTGKPKGVAISHRNLMPLLLWQEKRFLLGPQTRTLQTLALTFDFGLQEILTTTFFGGTLVFIDREQLLDSEQYAACVRDQAISMIYATPSFFSTIVETGRQFPSLKVLQLGGEMLTKEMLQGVFDLVPAGCRVFNGYGPTEAAINCMVYLADHASLAAHSGSTSIPIGRNSGNSLIYLLDRQLEPVPIGVAGEIYIGGPGVAHGYINCPDLTAERFVPIPFQTLNEKRETIKEALVERNSAFSVQPLALGGRLYKTGDLARYLPDGNVEFLGRIDHQVKIRGFRVELAEIETALMRHPNVRQAAVLMQSTGPHEKRICAYVVPQQPDLPPSDLRAFLRTSLPYYMIPMAIVPLQALPITPNGKLDRRALAAIDTRAALLDDSFVAPQTEIECQIAAIWQAALQIERVGLHDNFFELGAHSLMIANVHRQIQAALANTFPVVKMFEHPTIRLLAEYLTYEQDNAAFQQKSYDRAQKRAMLTEQQSQRQKYRRKTGQ